jgi:hypothetical protein
MGNVGDIERITQDYLVKLIMQVGSSCPRPITSLCLYHNEVSCRPLLNALNLSEASWFFMRTWTQGYW